MKIMQVAITFAHQNIIGEQISTIWTHKDTVPFRGPIHPSIQHTEDPYLFNHNCSLWCTQYYQTNLQLINVAPGSLISLQFYFLHCSLFFLCLGKVFAVTKIARMSKWFMWKKQISFQCIIAHSTKLSYLSSHQFPAKMATYYLKPSYAIEF